MRKLMLVLAVMTVVAAACGSSKGSSSSSTATKPSLPGQTNDHGSKAVKDGAKFEVEIDDFYFEPTFIDAPAGAKLTLELKNEGKTTHTFTSTALNVDQTLSPGQSMDVSVTVPGGAGSTEFHCKFHQGQGMQGAFAVT
jgi:plastocyanin